MVGRWTGLWRGEKATKSSTTNLILLDSNWECRALALTKLPGEFCNFFYLTWNISLRIRSQCLLKTFCLEHNKVEPNPWDYIHYTLHVLCTGYNDSWYLTRTLQPQRQSPSEELRRSLMRSRFTSSLGFSLQQELRSSLWMRNSIVPYEWGTL